MELTVLHDSFSNYTPLSERPEKEREQEEGDQKEADLTPLMKEEEVSIDIDMDGQDHVNLEPPTPLFHINVKRKVWLSLLCLLLCLCCIVCLFIFLCSILLTLFAFVSFAPSIHYEYHPDNTHYEVEDLYGEGPNDIPRYSHSFHPLAFPQREMEQMLQFFSISDLHIYSTYDPTKICNNGKQTVEKDHRDFNNYTLGQYKCDSPLSLLESLFKAMKRFNSNPDFILFTGDLFGHQKMSKGEYLEGFVRFRQVMQSYFPHTLLLPALGNHDLYPEDSYVEITPNNENLKEIAEGLLFTLPDHAISTFRHGGYYSLLFPSSSVLFVSLNDVIYTDDWYDGCKKLSSKPKCKRARGADPFGQLQWLRNELLRARLFNYRVVMAMHYGIGRSRGGDKQWEDDYQNHFLSILSEFSDVIRSLLTGHSHRDLFRLLPYHLQNKIAVMEVSSLTPTDGSNPSFRYNYLNRSSAEMIDYQHAFFDLRAFTRLEATEEEAWRMEYTFSKEYGVKPTAGGFIHLYNLLAPNLDRHPPHYSQTLLKSLQKYYQASSTVNRDRDTSQLLCSILHIINKDSAHCFSK